MATPKITFRSKKPPMSFTCWLGDDGAKPTGGYGGWNIIDRPRRIGITQWDGRQPLQMDVAILIDGFLANDNVETECRVLEAMAFSGDGAGEEPPVITISGDFVPHSAPTTEWIINGIQWGNTLRRTSDGKRLRQEAIVGLIRYSKYDKVQLSAAKRKRKKKGRK
jgi:hypothetical protein